MNERSNERMSREAKRIGWIDDCSDETCFVLVELVPVREQSVHASNKNKTTFMNGIIILALGIQIKGQHKREIGEGQRERASERESEKDVKMNITNL